VATASTVCATATKATLVKAAKSSLAAAMETMSMDVAFVTLPGLVQTAKVSIAMAMAA